MGDSDIEPLNALSPEGELPPPWEEVTTEEGQLYYWNSETNQTSWTRPGASAAVSEGALETGEKPPEENDRSEEDSDEPRQENEAESAALSAMLGNVKVVSSSRKMSNASEGSRSSRSQKTNQSSPKRMAGSSMLEGQTLGAGRSRTQSNRSENTEQDRDVLYENDVPEEFGGFSDNGGEEERDRTPTPPPKVKKYRKKRKKEPPVIGSADDLGPGYVSARIELMDSDENVMARWSTIEVGRPRTSLMHGDICETRGAFVSATGQVYHVSGDGTSEPAVVPTLMHKMRRVACGESFSVAVDLDGQAYSWGSWAQPAAGDGTGNSNSPDPPVPILESAKVVTVACGAAHAAVVTEDGNLFVWGENNVGQLGLGDFDNRADPTEVMELKGLCKAVACGSEHTAVLTIDGRVFTFGCGDMGRLGLGADIQAAPGVSSDEGEESEDQEANAAAVDLQQTSDNKGKPKGNAEVKTIDPTSKSPDEGESSGNGDDEVEKGFRNTPGRVDIKGVIDIACGHSHTTFVMDGGEVFSCGFGAGGQLGNDSTSDSDIPVAARLPDDDAGQCSQVWCGDQYTIGRGRRGNLLFWGTIESSEGEIVSTDIPKTVDGCPEFTLGNVICGAHDFIIIPEQLADYGDHGKPPYQGAAQLWGVRAEVERLEAESASWNQRKAKLKRQNRRLEILIREIVDLDNFERIRQEHAAVLRDLEETSEALQSQLMRERSKNRQLVKESAQNVLVGEYKKYRDELQALAKETNAEQDNVDMLNKQIGFKNESLMDLRPVFDRNKSDDHGLKQKVHTLWKHKENLAKESRGRKNRIMKANRKLVRAEDVFKIVRKHLDMPEPERTKPQQRNESPTKSTGPRSPDKSPTSPDMSGEYEDDEIFFEFSDPGVTTSDVTKTFKDFSQEANKNIDDIAKKDKEIAEKQAVMEKMTKQKDRKYGNMHSMIIRLNRIYHNWDFAAEHLNDMIAANGKRTFRKVLLVKRTSMVNLSRSVLPRSHRLSTMAQRDAARLGNISEDEDTGPLY